MLDLFPAFPAVPGLRYGISTRHGGVSTGGCSSLNLGYHVGDDPARVTENRRRLAAAVGYDAAALVTGQQVHGTGVTLVTAALCGRGAVSWDDALPATDGLLVAEPELPVAILVADCAPVLLVEPERRLLAVVHAGWRGALGRMASHAVRIMARLGGRPAAVLAALGPALCPACLEVGPEVAAAVEAVFGPAVIRPGAVKPHLDLHAMLTADLTDAGVPAARIIRHPDCTRCRNDRFFSHRGQHGQAGRIALVACWEKSRPDSPATPQRFDLSLP